jgi:hypothetical protein
MSAYLNALAVDTMKNSTYLDAKLLFTSTIPTLHPLYIVLAIILFIADPLSFAEGEIGPLAAVALPSPLSGSNSTM